MEGATIFHRCRSDKRPPPLSPGGGRRRTAMWGAAHLAAAVILVSGVTWNVETGEVRGGGVRASPAIPAPDAAPPASARRGPPLWRVFSEQGELWLLGSAHLSSGDQAWRRPEIDAALSAARAVYLEAALEPDAEVRRRMRDLGVGPPAFSLTSLLPAASRDRLRRVAAARELDLEYLDRLRPWLASLTLRAAHPRAPSGEDVDSYIERQARMLNKPVLYLETWETQIRVLAELPEASQIRLLERDLAALEAQRPAQTGLIEAWFAGDDARLEALVFENADRFPVYFERLFARRNQAWAQQLAAALEQDGVVLAVVGAGHLYGPKGLLNLLGGSGWKVERR